jgi:energy-coupling factor transporter transmembrane protein EcfT
MSKQRIGFVCDFGHAIVPENYTAIFQLAGARKAKPVKTGKQRSPMHRLPKIVLLLILLMAVLSPFMQLDSWDNFPVATGDIELQIISVLFTAGMFFVFAGILSLFPGLLRSGFLIPSLAVASRNPEFAVPEAELSSFAVPLRI